MKKKVIGAVTALAVIGASLVSAQPASANTWNKVYIANSPNSKSKLLVTCSGDKVVLNPGMKTAKTCDHPGVWVGRGYKVKYYWFPYNSPFWIKGPKWVYFGGAGLPKSTVYTLTAFNR